MNSFPLKYGKEIIHAELSDDQVFDVIKSKSPENSKTEEDIILEALENPIASPKLRDIVKPNDKVCIVISDITRAWQKMWVYLPYIVRELKIMGVADQDIIFISATGSHRSQSEEEHKKLLGNELKDRFKIIDHDCLDDNNLVDLGTTSYGTPVKINKMALDCDHIIVTGAIVYHLLAGWGGGKKSILPGIAGYETIMANHAMSLNPEVGRGSNPEIRSGKIVGNPIYEDMLQAAHMVKPSFLFNVIMDPKGNISHAVAGHYEKAHEKGCEIVDSLDGVFIEDKADIVIASAGGYPKDINLYQTVKTIINAKEAVNDQGVIIILSECSEGMGNPEVKEFIQNYDNLLAREQALRENYTIAKYIGYYATEVAAKNTMILVSSLPPEALAMADIMVVKSLDEALKMAYNIKGKKAKTYIMPNAANTLPKLKRS